MHPLSHPLRSGLLRGSNGHAAGRTFLSFMRLIFLPASCPSLPLRDGLRYADGTGSMPFPLLPVWPQGAEGTL